MSPLPRLLWALAGGLAVGIGAIAVSQWTGVPFAGFLVVLAAWVPLLVLRARRRRR